MQPLFEAVKWAGACYLVYLGVQSVRSAVRGQYPPLDQAGGPPRTGNAALAGWRQGFLSNITNPKVLVFYLAVLPQFLPAGAGVAVVLAFALSQAVLSLGYLLLLATALQRARGIFERRRVRRVLDATTGAVLIGFSARLIAEHA
jgi:threonine/homoserine/homoserine lactone efflux protein